MRGKARYIITSCLLLCTASLTRAADAEARKGAKLPIHHIAFWGGGGYSSMIHHYANSRAIGGGGGMIGVGYEYRLGHLVVDIGAEYKMFTSQDHVSFTDPFIVRMNADGYGQTKRYTFLSPLRETHVVGQLTVPLMLGGSWGGWYALGGAKIGYAVQGNYSQQGRYATAITDPQAYDSYWTNMPDHGAFAEVAYSSRGKTDYGMDVALSAEVGVNITDMLGGAWSAGRYAVHARLGLFADYGVLNLSRPVQGAIATADEDVITTRSLHESDRVQGGLNSLLVGVKFTALLQLNRPRRAAEPKSLLVLYVSDRDTDQRIPSATVALTRTVKDKTRTLRYTTNARGAVSAKLPAGDYRLQLTHPDYYALADSLQHGRQPDTLHLTMAPCAECRKPAQAEPADTLTEPVRRIVLHNLFFASGETTILTESEPELMNIYSLLTAHPDVRIRIIGHTDNTGPEAFNKDLSEGRAHVVRDFLILQGIDAGRIEVEGRGMAAPLDTNDTPAGRARNRRVEIVVL